jgi:hypothetical protein
MKLIYRGNYATNEKGDAVVYAEAPDLKRIVACVNACQGIPTENLEVFAKGGIGSLVESLIQEGYSNLDVTRREYDFTDLGETDIKLLLPRGDGK